MIQSSTETIRNSDDALNGTKGYSILINCIGEYHRNIYVRDASSSDMRA